MFDQLRSKLFGAKQDEPIQPPDQAVLVHLDATGLPAEIYETYDLATLEDTLEHIIAEQSLGEFDGNELGPGEVTLFMYGPDAEKLYGTCQHF